MKDMSADGTLRPETKCWAQGMDGWRPLQNIPQLKWYLLATGIAVMNETDLAVKILKMLIKICEFYPNRFVFSHEYSLRAPWEVTRERRARRDAPRCFALRRAFFFKMESLLPGYPECILETSGIPLFSTHICVAQPVSSKVFVMLPWML